MSPPLSLSLSSPEIGFIGGGFNSAFGYTYYTSGNLEGLFRLEAGCFSRDAAVNRATAKRYAVDPERTYASWDELMPPKAGRLDAVVVLTPTPTHADILTALLQAQLPMICEKALATSVTECTAIERSLVEYQGFLAVTYNYSGYPMFRVLVARRQPGELGRQHQIQVEMP